MDKEELKNFSDSHIVYIGTRIGGLKIALEELNRRRFYLLSDEASGVNPQAHASSIEKSIVRLGRERAKETAEKHRK